MQLLLARDRHDQGEVLDGLGAVVDSLVVGTHLSPNPGFVICAEPP